MNWMRKLPPWYRPVLLGLMGMQAMAVVIAMWYGWGVQPFAQWITPALACLTLNSLILAGFKRDAERSPQ